MDIGCWHPINASNTYYFYLRGLKGICIDPNPKLKLLYHKLRKRDVSINSAIGPGKQHLKYYLLGDNYSSMNTLNYDFIKKHHLENQIKITINVPLQSLKNSFR